MRAACRNGWFPASTSPDGKNHSCRWPPILNWGFHGVTHVTRPSRWKCNSWRYFEGMNRIVRIFLSVAILSSAFLSCSTESDARGDVLKESEIFLAINFQLESSEEFLRDCLFPVAFRERWLGDWETTLQAMRNGSGNPLPNCRRDRRPYALIHQR